MKLKWIFLLASLLVLGLAMKRRKRENLETQEGIE